jgi:hypothetical protein
MVEQDGFEIGPECRLDEAPHVLVAAEAVGEYHGLVAGAVDVDVVSNYRSHCTFPNSWATSSTTFHSGTARRRYPGAPAGQGSGAAVFRIRPFRQSLPLSIKGLETGTDSGSGSF